MIRSVSKHNTHTQAQPINYAAPALDHCLDFKVVCFSFLFLLLEARNARKSLWLLLLFLLANGGLLHLGITISIYPQFTSQ
jgi:hypothetical protein